MYQPVSGLRGNTKRLTWAIWPWAQNCPLQPEQYQWTSPIPCAAGIAALHHYVTVALTKRIVQVPAFTCELDGARGWDKGVGQNPRIPPTDESWPCTLAASLSHIHPALNARCWSTCVIATIVGTSCMPLRCLQLLWLHLTFKISLYGCTVSFILYIKKWSQEELQKIIQGYTAHTWKNSCSKWDKLGPLLHCAAMRHVEMFLQN